MTDWRDLDGANAGGQFLRTALTLSILEGRPVRLENVRGDRSTPGLGHQHLAIFETLAALSDADVTGAEIGAETVTFDPGDPTLEGGEYAVDIETAGSISLLFDAVVPLATVLESPLSLSVTGGTDVAWSPPIEYVQQVKLPLLRRFGLVAACEIDRRGFYPDGGGTATLHLAPSRLEPIELVDPGSLEDVRLYSTESESLSDRNVAHRQLEGALERLDDSLDSRLVERRETTAASDCPGSAIVVRLEFENGIAGCSALGERGTPAERVGEDAADAANRVLEGGWPVDRHLGDQLLVYLSIAGGRVRVPALTDHVRSSCTLLEAFGVDVSRASPSATDIDADESIGDRPNDTDGAVLSVPQRATVNIEPTADPNY
ncbi:RNA 3'-terminal phosphate cyclase [Salinadaptatus halalkaliphilus]|uniref:RNA 3'-terminal phosphate cyclase n=1 Tax=Salinadaptatus halalkaliphilus TaxID=2419781 RepID=A0A4S3TQ12_9EURY|nr:RNA 3'-terminal phosphate cyclase [Salinadaptatus halalkaliphilus]THE65323.1 RNA 3'-terminal phosphate cyclase [Salinadaptatus halalkaliphilus]